MRVSPGAAFIGCLFGIASPLMLVAYIHNDELYLNLAAVTVLTAAGLAYEIKREETT